MTNISWIETALQTLLTTYKLTNTTALEKVAVLDTNARERKYQDYLEDKQLLIIYRELPGLLPDMPVADKIISCNLFVYGLEEEKTAINALINTFIETYNSTYQASITARLRFTNLTAIGRADNKGSKFYMAWQFGANITIDDSITTIYDRSVTYNSKTITALKGLVSARLEKIPVYAEYPTSALAEGREIRYVKFRLTFSILDNDDTDVASLKDYIYDESYSASTTYTSGTESITFTGKIISAIDSITEQGFPLLTFVIERG